MAQLTVRPFQAPPQDGTIITIQGSTPPQANGFSINLSCGPGDIGTSDIALHINPRFNENAVPRNSFQSGSWGAEDRAAPMFPLQKGTPFECIILVQQDKYMVSFNGQHYCEFRHRLPKERVSHIVIKGDVQINNVMFTGPGSFGGAPFQPAGSGFGQPQQPGGFGGQPSYGQVTQPGGAAQRKMIPGGLVPGKIIYLNGTPTPTAARFTINLKSQEQGGDIQFHFNPRFAERVVAKNNLQNGSWGQEERASAPFPFVAGTPFQMMILGDPQEFKVAVNGAHFTEFRLRNVSLQAAQWVEIEGDVTGVTINIP